MSYAERLAKRQNAQQRADKKAEKAAREKVHTVEFSLRAIFPMISVKRVVDLVLRVSRSVKASASARQTRTRPISSLNSVSVYNKSMSFFTQSYIRPLHKTTLIYDAIAKNMYACAVEVTREYAKKASVSTDELSTELEACAYAAVEAIYNGYACVDGIFGDLFRFLLGECSDVPTDHTRNAVARDVLRAIMEAPSTDVLRATVARSPALAATAAALLLTSDNINNATGMCAQHAAQNVEVELKAKQDGDVMLDASANNSASIHDEKGQTLDTLKTKTEQAVQGVDNELRARARNSGVDTGESRKQQTEANAALCAMSESLLSPDASEHVTGNSSLSNMQDRDGGVKAGNEDGDHVFDTDELRSALRVYKTLISTEPLSGRAKRRPYLGTKWDNAAGRYVKVYKDEFGEQTTEQYGNSQTFAVANVLDVWRAVGRVEGFMTDAINVSRHGDGEIVGVECGNELQHMLPSELVNFAMPEMRALWASRFVEETLLITSRKGAGESGAGPIIAMVDISYSMNRDVDFRATETSAEFSVKLVSLAKAFALSLAKYAAQWNRKCVIVPFDYTAKMGHAVFACEHNKRVMRDQLKALCGLNPNGGTSFTAAMTKAAEIINERPDDYEYADIVFFTDGEGDVRCNCASHFPGMFDAGPPQGWRDDILIKDALRKDRERILRECGLSPDVRTYAFMLTNGVERTSNRRAYTGDFVPLARTSADKLEHTNTHLFDACVSCAPDTQSMQDAVTRFYATLIKEAFYREF